MAEFLTPMVIYYWKLNMFIWGLIFSVLGIFICVGFVFSLFSNSTDDSDTEGPMGIVRSGLNVRTDYGTGCQYLETSKGHLTPRLDENGKQVCAQDRNDLKGLLK